MPRTVSQEYSALLHYTTASGLVGIIESGTLWASHARFLNDATELTHFFDERMPKLAKDPIREFVENKRTDPSTESWIQSEGGMDAVVNKTVSQVVDMLRTATLAFHQPYIFSMSGVKRDGGTTSARLEKHGLLSQWRGYGGDGGYAIVLDADRFENLLLQEFKTLHYQFQYFGDVYYYGSELKKQPATEEVAKFEENVKRGVVAVALGQNTEIVPQFYESVASLPCIYKHWGFYEEQEVRVVAIPPTSEVAADATAAGETLPLPAVEFFQRGGAPVPYLALFETSTGSKPSGRLPIKRVIVGPHRNKGQRVQAVKHLLSANGYVDVEVVWSDIPYLGA